MDKPIEKLKVAVIGGGPGGYAAAFKAADLGMNVSLIDQELNPGGVCLYRGCIPSKALLHTAKLVYEAEEAIHWGIEFPKPKIKLSNLRKWKNDVVTKLTGGLGQLCKARRVNFIQGTATFIDSQTLEIKSEKGSIESKKFDYTIVATGSTPTSLPNNSIESPRIMDSTSALEVDEIPKSLLIFGGGYIGLELGTVYNALGSEVTVVEMTSGLLPGVDRDLVTVLQNKIKRHNISTFLNTKATILEETGNGLKVQLESEGKNPTSRVFNKILVAIGRRPNSSGLGLENTRIKVDSKGFVKINSQCRTDDPHILAIGDVVGGAMLAHKATHEGMVAAEVIAGKKVEFLPAAIPAVVFTDPEIAWCGLTETEAEKSKQPIHVSKFPWAASGRALTLGQTNGLTKLIIDPETERILGVAICGPNAGELIAEGTLAIEMAALATDMKLTIHPHPTLSETVMESAELFFGPSTHMFRPKKKNQKS